MDGRAIFGHLISTMEIDHNTCFEATDEEFSVGAVLCENLRDAGYFAGSPDDVDGDFWKAATGDYQRAMAHFKNHPAYIKLNNILEHIFVEGAA